MKIPNQDILEYVKTQRVCILAVEMLDGSPHAATVHFAHNENPLTFFFETNREYRKCEALFGRDVTRASLVIGFDEVQPRTFQLDGNVRLLNDDEKGVFDEIYFAKFPKKIKDKDKSGFVQFVFLPTWWRFTDWTCPEGKLILNSDENS